MSDAINFRAELYKVQTLVDGGYRLTLDLGEQDLKAITDLMECKKRGALLEIAVVPVKQEGIRKDAEVSTRSEWES